MNNPKPHGAVLLAEQQPASAVLHAVLADTAAAFPLVFNGIELPVDAKAFRNTYPDVLPRFEATRLASGERSAIARHAVAVLEHNIIWQDESGCRPLPEALTEPAAPIPLEMHAFGGEPGWQPSLVYRGERWDAARLAELGAEQVRRGLMTPNAGEALAWVGERVLDEGTLRLSGRKIAVLGGGAEMAPTRFWLEAGADVLWLDVVPPPENWLASSDIAGRLYWPAGNVDLLTRPQEVLATLIAFADGDPLDLGLYAYAPGQARELRLTSTMNALVNALPPDLVGSVTILVSPTTATGLSSQDLAAMRARRQARPAWEAALAGLGLLGRGGGSVAVGDAAATRTVVAIQGASYQAAQYLGKVLVAECWATHGAPGSATASPLRVSANTAAITRTRSLAHPVFAAAFGGAAAFGVETLAPRQSRRLNGLLAVRDWLRPEPPTPGSVRVHGSIHTLPYPLESALRVAAAIGFARSPRLLRGLLGRS
ncbi:MAG: hypothetical protein OES38_05910 [Gammaproteobacteria bacterium]|nr:hypothetical protein [Gammaproteobacteria bacterium]